jgi:CRP-like cAMP-binding protein
MQLPLPARLARLPVFEDLSPRDREVLSAVLREVELKPGQVLYETGARAAECHIVLHGELEVFTREPDGSPLVLGLFGPGEILGEVAIIDGGPRSAGCRAGNGGGRVAALSKPDFDQIFSGASPFAFKLMDLLATRLVRRMRGQMSRLVEAVVAADGESR